MRAKNLSTPSRSNASGKSKGKKIVYRTPSTPKEGSRPSQSNISDTTKPKHAVAPAYFSSKYKAVWLPYEGDSEDEYEDGVPQLARGGKRNTISDCQSFQVRNYGFFVLNNLYYFINLVTFQFFIITKIGHMRIENYGIKIRPVG